MARHSEERRTPGDRLRRAIEQQRPAMTFNRFHQLLRARLGDVETKKRTGVSYGSINNYVNNRSEVPLSVLLEAAEVLGVRPAWLVLDEGPMSEREEWIEVAAKHIAEQLPEAGPSQSDSLPSWVDALEDALRAAGWWAPWVTIEMKSQFAMVVSELAQACGDYPLLKLETYDVLASDVAWLITLPLRSWGFEPPSSGRWLRNYVMASLGALQVAIHQPGQGPPLDEYHDSILPRLRSCGIT